MSSHFKLWPVGQGLFYSGSTNHNEEFFNFVYDCGGGSKRTVEKLVESYVSKYNLRDKSLDMLVISHFDDDHVKGIPKLLSEVSKVNKIFIPYAGGIKNYLLLLTLVYGSSLNIHLKVNEIIFVNPSELNNKEEQNNDFDELETSEEDLENLEDLEYFKLPGIRISLLKKQNLVFKNIWKFKFYNTYLNSNNDDLKIQRELKSLWRSEGYNGLEDLLQNFAKPLKNDSSMTVRKAILAIYKKYCLKNNNNSEVNQSSLCLYHSPLKNSNKRSYDFLVEFHQCCCPYGCSYYSSMKIQQGTMLTGDISLQDDGKGGRYDHFKKYFKNEVKDVFCFLIPHHGAKNNWTRKILKDFSASHYFMNSAGVSNKYGHPSDRVILDIIKSGRKILYCNENITVYYEIY